jgi:hypothetical protein
MTQGDTPYLISPNAGLLQGQDERGSVPLGRHSGFVLMPGWKRREGCAAGTDAGGGRMGGPPCVAAAVPGGRGRGECGGARPRPERACLPRCLFYLGCAAGPVGCIAWCTVTGQWSTRSPVGGRGSAFAIWGGTTPWNPPLRFAPRDGTSPAHRPLTGPKGPGSLCWPGGTTPLEPPGALRAPRWYFAGTPAAHRAQGARFASRYERLAVTRSWDQFSAIGLYGLYRARESGHGGGGGKGRSAALPWNFPALGGRAISRPAGIQVPSKWRTASAVRGKALGFAKRSRFRTQA